MDWCALKGPAFFAYADNYLIDVRFGVIVDVEASRAVRQAEVGAARTMIERTEQRFGLKPQRLAGDSAYGSASMLNRLVEEKQIAPHIPVFDKSQRDDGTFSRDDFLFDKERDIYTVIDRISGSVLAVLLSVSGHAAAAERQNTVSNPRRFPITQLSLKSLARLFTVARSRCRSVELIII